MFDKKVILTIFVSMAIATLIAFFTENKNNEESYKALFRDIQ